MASSSASKKQVQQEPGPGDPFNVGSVRHAESARVRLFLPGLGTGLLDDEQRAGGAGGAGGPARAGRAGAAAIGGASGGREMSATDARTARKLLKAAKYAGALDLASGYDPETGVLLPAGPGGSGGLLGGGQQGAFGGVLLLDEEEDVSDEEEDWNGSEDSYRRATAGSLGSGGAAAGASSQQGGSGSPSRKGGGGGAGSRPGSGAHTMASRNASRGADGMSPLRRRSAAMPPDPNRVPIWERPMPPPGGVPAREKLLAAQAAAPPRMLKAVAAKVLSLGGGGGLALGETPDLFEARLAAGPALAVTSSSFTTGPGASAVNSKAQVQVAASRSAKSFTAPVSPLATLQQLASGTSGGGPLPHGGAGSGSGDPLGSGSLRPTSRQTAAASAGAAVGGSTRAQQLLALVPNGSTGSRAPVGRATSLHNLLATAEQPAGGAGAAAGLAGRRGVGTLNVNTPQLQRELAESQQSISPHPHHSRGSQGSPRAAAVALRR